MAVLQEETATATAAMTKVATAKAATAVLDEGRNREEPHNSGRRKNQTVFPPPKTAPSSLTKPFRSGKTVTVSQTFYLLAMGLTDAIRGLPIRYKVSAPADQFTADSGVKGASAAPGTEGAMGMNVLLHGDGGQSFFDFPNQGVNDNLMGVAVLTPDPDLKWGGADKNGQQRPDGVAHSQAVADLVTQELPKVVAYNKSNVFFTGVSGGSLTLSGFFMPAHMGNFTNTGVMLNCGGMAPQVQFTKEAAAAMANTRIHFQSTTQELKSLQGSIPQSVQAYEKAAAAAGLGDQQINALQTVDNSPNGVHCEFDEKDFVSGVQLMADNYQNVMLPGGSGQVGNIGNVNKGVVGNEKLQFSKEGRR